MRSLKMLGGTIAAAAAAMALTMSAWANPVKTEYAFTTGTNTITVGEAVDSVIGKLGEAGDVKTLTNCANGGKDKAYIYDNFDIYTTCLLYTSPAFAPVYPPPELLQIQSFK